MKKRIFLMFVCLCMLCGMLCACSGLNREPIYSSFEEKEATLIVNGQTLDVDGVYVYDGFEFRYPDASRLVPLKYPEAYAKLPLVATLRALGAEVEWQDETHAVLSLGEKVLLLDIAEQTVSEPGKNDTWVHVAAGHFVSVRETVDGDLLVDDTSIDEVLFYFYGNQTPTFTIMDWENATVTVTVQDKTE